MFTTDIAAPETALNLQTARLAKTRSAVGTGLSATSHGPTPAERAPREDADDSSAIDTGALVAIASETALSVFTADGAMDPILARIKAEIDAFVPDMTTGSGRQQIRTMAYKVVRSKTYLEKLGKDLEDAQKAIPKKINAVRKAACEQLEEWADAVRKPLTDWEEAEKARVAGVKAALDDLRGAVARCIGWTAPQIEAEMARLLAFDVSGLGEHSDLASTLKGTATEGLRAALGKCRQQEADAAELAKLRQELARRAEQDRAAAAQKAIEDAAAQRADEISKAARDAETRAFAKAAEDAKAERQKGERELARAQQTVLAEREAAARREADMKLAVERAERSAVETAQRIKREADDEAKARADLQAERDADTANRAGVHRIALAALMAGGIDEPTGKTAIKLIVAGKVPGVSITY